MRLVKLWVMQQMITSACKPGSAACFACAVAESFVFCEPAMAVLPWG
jgi:hypothetical protein